MNIIHIISGDIWAGAEVQAYHTLSALSDKPNLSLICVVFNNGIFKNNLEKKNIKTIMLDETKFNSFSLLIKLKRLICNTSPDVIHVHAVKEHLLVKLALILCCNKIPIVRTVHGARKAPDNLPFNKYLRSKLVVFLDNLLITYAAEAVIAVSKDLEQQLLKRKVKGKVCHIYNAISTDEYRLEKNNSEIREAYGVGHRFWIGTAARLAEPKNLQMLVKAGKYMVERDFPFKISIFGEGPMKQELQELIDRYFLSDQVELHGFEPEMLPVISELDVFVLCSIHEGFPMALLEAMLLKTPVVCTAVGGIREVIDDGINGLLVSLDDSKALAHSIISLSQNHDLACQLANNARSTLDQRFCLSKTTDLLLMVYDRIQK